MLFQVLVLAAAVAAYGAGVLMWQSKAKPMLRRRYERAHFRRKASRR